MPISRQSATDGHDRDHAHDIAERGEQRSSTYHEHEETWSRRTGIEQASAMKTIATDTET